MNRRAYLAEVIRLFREAPESLSAPTRRDWAIAGDLYRREVDLDVLAHAIRIATLRRQAAPDRQPIRSLAYYRAVLDALTDQELEPTYVDYVKARYGQFLIEQETAV